MNATLKSKSVQAMPGYPPWRGVVEQYREWLPPLPDGASVITLGEGATPLLPAPVLPPRCASREPNDQAPAPTPRCNSCAWSSA